MEKDIVQNQNIPVILIVDDVPANLKVLGDILKHEGYLIRQVPNGRLALQVAEKEKPDIILLDIMMPGMDGYEVCQQLKENPTLNDIPVIFISALSDIEDIVKAFNYGGVDYITKPFNAKEVKVRVATHLKICQQTRELQKLNADKDKFFSIIAHDLRGPLGSFLGLTQFMAEELHSLEMNDIQRFVTSMQKSAANLSSLLENLLQWSQMQKGAIIFNPKVVQLSSIVVESIAAIQISAKNKQIEIVTDIPDGLEVIADSQMLKTIIRNLVSNAVKFTPEGGKIKLFAKTGEDQNVDISVHDTGIGMNAEILANLFRLDVKTTRKGTKGEPSTGLGLQLCKEFAEKQDGKLWVESEEGKGSAFHLRIPCPARLAEKTVSQKVDLAVKEVAQANGLKILIAEDEETSEKLLTWIVGEFSKEILIVKTGIDAVEACRNHPDIDLVLMDIQMPEMNGYEAIRQIRKLNPEIVIIAQTSFSMSGDREKSLEAGSNDYISKPIRKEELIALIRNYFKI